MSAPDLTPARTGRALLLENIHPHAVDLLGAAGFEVRTHRGAMDEAELLEAVQGVSVLGIRSTTHVTEAVLAGKGENKKDIMSILGASSRPRSPVQRPVLISAQ